MNCYGKRSQRFKISVHKKMNKANQYLSEKLGLAQGSEYGHDFLSKQRDVENRKKLADKIKTTTKKFLFPGDIVTRLKMSSSAALKEHPLTMEQPEGVIGETMLAGVEDISLAGTYQAQDYSRLLYETSIAMKNLAILRNKLIEEVDTFVLKPQSALKKDYAQLERLKAKLESRRLDYDCRRRKMAKANSHVGEEDLRIAERKFFDLKSVIEDAMVDFIQKDVERSNNLRHFGRAMLRYHRQSAEVLEQLVNGDPEHIHVPVPDTRLLSIRTITTMQMRQQQELKGGHIEKGDSVSPPSQHDYDDAVPMPTNQQPDSADGPGTSPELPTSPALCSPSPSKQTPPPPLSLEICEALEDFLPSENHRGDTLTFRKGDRLQIIGPSSDDNWLWGRTFDGQTGFIPITYVTKSTGANSITPPTSEEHRSSPSNDETLENSADAVADDDNNFQRHDDELIAEEVRIEKTTINHYAEMDDAEIYGNISSPTLISPELQQAKHEVDV